MNSFYSLDELISIGFKSIGENVLLSRKASIYNPEQMSLGNNVRIDDFCILSGKICIGNYIHIAAYSALYGGIKGIYIEDFANVSSRVSIYSICDDFSGESMSNPMVPGKYKNVINKEVHIEKYVIIGATAVILPGVILAEGSTFGSFSLIDHDSEKWSSNVGIPFKRIGERSKKMLAKAQTLIINAED